MLLGRGVPTSPLKVHVEGADGKSSLDWTVTPSPPQAGNTFLMGLWTAAEKDKGVTVGVAIPTPGTLGGFHAFYLLCLTEAFGIPKGTAAAAGIAAHALANLPLLGFGLVLMGREGLTLGKVARMTDDEP